MPDAPKIMVMLTKPQVAACLDALNWNVAKQRKLAQVHDVNNRVELASMHEERQRQAEQVQKLFQAILMHWPQDA